jgi:3',5'-cyclic AMP phosphodiesterase CpdA
MNPTRRSILQSGVATGLGLGAVRLVRADELQTPAKGALRVAHLTDMHVEPGARRAGEGYGLALRSLGKLEPKPALLITGGDHIMDGTGRLGQDVAAQWDVYQQALKENIDLPVYPVIGNHDVFGWSIPEQVPASTRGYGKAQYLERMNRARSYYSFDAGGWHFVCLDNIAPRGAGFFAHLGAEQTAWLKSDLEKNPRNTPVCVVSHVPLLTACALFDDGVPNATGYALPDSYMHHDVKPLLSLLRQHGVKVCLSGHIHLVDRVDYLGMTFLCNGAVSGNWWKGPRQEFPEGYGIIDFYADGTFQHQYATYGWVAKV